jgi:type III restriction enzyme
MNIEVPQPIVNSPFEKPTEHWRMVEGEAPERRPGRRRAVYYYRGSKAKDNPEETGTGGTPVELTLVNLIRERVEARQNASYPGVARLGVAGIGPSPWRSECKRSTT